MEAHGEKNRSRSFVCARLRLQVLEVGLEPTQPQWPKDFKSFVSTIPPFEQRVISPCGRVVEMHGKGSKEFLNLQISAADICVGRRGTADKNVVWLKAVFHFQGFAAVGCAAGIDVVGAAAFGAFHDAGDG